MCFTFKKLILCNIYTVFLNQEAKISASENIMDTIINSYFLNGILSKRLKLHG